jgi:hypothetical protein
MVVAVAQTPRTQLAGARRGPCARSTQGCPSSMISGHVGVPVPWYPYFTNGSAHSIDEVLEAVRFSKGETFHAKAPDGAERLDEAGKRALAAFLELL